MWNKTFYFSLPSGVRFFSEGGRTLWPHHWNIGTSAGGKRSFHVLNDILNKYFVGREGDDRDRVYTCVMLN
jgi:hypothetical protein